jgi:hypothetical protein
MGQEGDDVVLGGTLDLVDAALPPPGECLQPVGTFRLAEVLLGEMAEGQPEADAIAAAKLEVDKRAGLT